MADLQGQKSNMLQLIDALKSELAKELALAESDPNMNYFLGDYSKTVRTRMDQLVDDIRGLDKQMDALRETIRDAFTEQKKFELALENHEKREREKSERRETAEMDEVAGNQHTRRQEEHQS